MAKTKVKRIRRKNTDRIATADDKSSCNNNNNLLLIELSSLQKMRRLRLLIGGIVLLMISSITVTTNAFQHPLSITTLSSLPSRKKYEYQQQHRNQQQHYYFNKNDQNRRRQRQQQAFVRRPLMRLSAEESASSDDTWSSSSSAAASSPSVDLGIAAVDQEFRALDNDFDFDHINDDEEEDDDDDDDIYKDFENFDYTPFLEKELSIDSIDEDNNDDITSSSVSTSSSPTTATIVEEDIVVETSVEDKTTLKEEQQQQQDRPAVAEQSVHVVPITGFNVVLTHCTADFDSLASAVGLAKLWSSQTSIGNEDNDGTDDDGDYDSSSNNFPTFVVLPRGCHPDVQRFLGLHKHLFPIRSLKSLPKDLSKLHRLALVDAQRKDRIGPAEVLLQHADRITVVDHHVDMESDIANITDYVVDGVGSVSTLIIERLMRQQEKQQAAASLSSSPLPVSTLTAAEATLLALGIHADTGSLCYDSTTPRDASALAWVMAQGASQIAIAEHAQTSLSPEQQKVLTQALVNANATVAHGVTVTTVLLTADGFINGLAAVTKDAMELSSADVFLLGVVYEPKSGRGGRNKKTRQPGENVKARLLKGKEETIDQMTSTGIVHNPSSEYMNTLQKLRSSFDKKDLDGDGYIDRKELSAALVASGIIATEDTILGLMETIDTNKDDMICFEEFVKFSNDVQTKSRGQNYMLLSENKKSLSSSSSKEEDSSSPEISTSPPSTLIIIGRVKPGVNTKSVNLGKLLEKHGGGGHPKAASATVRLNDESEAAGIMKDLVDELIETSLQEQATVGDFMTSPVLSVKPDMTEIQVEDLFTRYDVRALPVVNEGNEVIGLVTYKEVAAAKQRMWNKEQKRLRQEENKKKHQQDNNDDDDDDSLSQEEKNKIIQQQKIADEQRRKGPTVKAWMKQHIKTVEASLTMAEVEAILLENDVGCIPVVQDGSRYLVGMVTRTDLLRQHRYYPSLHYNNKGMSDSIAARAPIIALRKKLKQFDLDE